MIMPPSISTPRTPGVAKMRAKMEDMAQEFGDMLKETLDRMRERIEVSSAHSVRTNQSASISLCYIAAAIPSRNRDPGLA